MTKETDWKQEIDEILTVYKLPKKVKIRIFNLAEEHFNKRCDECLNGTARKKFEKEISQLQAEKRAMLDRIDEFAAMHSTYGGSVFYSNEMPRFTEVVTVKDLQKNLAILKSAIKDGDE